MKHTFEISELIKKNVEVELPAFRKGYSTKYLILDERTVAMFDNDGKSMKFSNSPEVWLSGTEESTREEFLETFNLYKENFERIIKTINQ
mgnify:CR=1 FL=1